MKDLKINNRTQRVFVLKETEDRIVYIPIKALHITDYQRLLDIEKKFKNDMLDGMYKTRLDNGRNALAQYDNIIQVMQKTSEKTGERLLKPEEGNVRKMVQERDAEQAVIRKQQENKEEKDEAKQNSDEQTKPIPASKKYKSRDAEASDE